MTVSQLADNESLYEGHTFGTKGEVIDAIKTFSIKSHQQYYINKSSTTLLKQKCKWESERQFGTQNARDMSYGKLRNTKTHTFALIR